DERLPQAAGAEVGHRMARAVPSVEVADHRHAPRVGRPDDERVAAAALDFGRPRAHLLPRAQPVALAEEIGLVVRDDAPRIGGNRFRIHRWRFYRARPDRTCPSVNSRVSRGTARANRPSSTPKPNGMSRLSEMVSHCSTMPSATGSNEQ